MTWTNLPASNDTDWSSVAFLNQFASAINERITATRSTATIPPVDSLSVGSDAQLAATFNQWQTRIESLMDRFIEAPGDAVPDGTNYARFTTPLSSGNRWRTMAGLDAAGWTRKYPREIANSSAPGSEGWLARPRGTSGFTPGINAGGVYRYTSGQWVLQRDSTVFPDVLTSYGRMQAGDYIGPWLWNEMRAALSLQQAVTFTFSPGFGRLTLNETQTRSGSGSTSDAAIASALSLPPSYSTTAGNFPEAYNRVFHNVGTGTYSAYAKRTRWTVIPPGAGARHVKLWVQATLPDLTDNFDDFDDGLSLGWQLYIDTTTSDDTPVQIGSQAVTSTPTPWYVTSDARGGAGWKIPNLWGYVSFDFTYS